MFVTASSTILGLAWIKEGNQFQGNGHFTERV